MADYSSQDFFVLSTKDKLWLVTMDNENVSITEFKNPKLSEFSIDFPKRDAIPIFELGSKSPIDLVEMGESPAEAEFKIMCLPSDLKQISGSRKNIQPDEFYSLKELQKISKMMTRKLEKASNKQ